MNCVAILKFKLPEQEEDFKVAQNAFDYKFAIQDFSEWMRRSDKHDLPKGWDQKTLNEIREKFYEIIRERELDLY